MVEPLMARYLALLSKDTDSAFGVHFPDLPGCTAAGDTEADALSNAAVALRLWAEDIDHLPTPSELEKFIARRDVKEDLARGSIIMAVDLITASRKQRINIMMEPDLVSAADEAARVAGVNRSQLIETAVTRLLGARIADVRSPQRKATHSKS
jgi:predicted RNase H-like HicB family nuclease